MASAVIIESGSDLTLPKGTSIYESLSDELRQTLTPSQKEQMQAIPAVQSWKNHPLDIRLHFPFFKDGYYLTIIGGKESRSNKRRASERQNFPLKTVANTIFFMGFGVILAFITLAVMALQSAIIEF